MAEKPTLGPEEAMAANAASRIQQADTQDKATRKAAAGMAPSSKAAKPAKRPAPQLKVVD